MPVSREERRRSIRILLRVIERIYGPDNIDTAGDAIVNALRDVSDYPGQFRYSFEVDSNNPNPWYHALVFSIEGIPDPTYSRFLVLLNDLGLAEHV